MAEPILTVQSHEEGRNADVYLYPDRIERIKQRSRISVSRASQDAEVIPMRPVTSVETKKAGMRTDVIVYASANTVTFRLGHDEARRFKDAILAIVLGGPPAATPAPAPAAAAPAAPSVSAGPVPGPPSGWQPPAKKRPWRR